MKRTIKAILIFPFMVIASPMIIVIDWSRGDDPFGVFKHWWKMLRNK